MGGDTVSNIRLEDEVLWTPTGDTGRVIGLTTEPSAVVEFSQGRRVTIGLSKLEKVPPPVPPLPTDPYTVIRVTWKITGNEAGFTLKQDGSWRGANEDVEAEELAQAITGFKVLAEPRAVTAKAVLDRVREEFAAHSWSRRYIETIAGEFEVES